MKCFARGNFICVKESESKMSVCGKKRERESKICFSCLDERSTLLQNLRKHGDIQAHPVDHINRSSNIYKRERKHKTIIRTANQTHNATESKTTKSKRNKRKYFCYFILTIDELMEYFGQNFIRNLQSE